MKVERFHTDTGPAALFQRVQQVFDAPRRLKLHGSHLAEWAAEREAPVADIEQGHISSASCILANISQHLGGRTITWDPATHQCVGDEEANKLLKRPYRDPWKHPAG